MTRSDADTLARWIVSLDLDQLGALWHWITLDYFHRLGAEPSEARWERLRDDRP